MKIVVSGSSGLVGTALVARLTRDAHEVVPLLRSKPAPGAPGIHWHPLTGVVDHKELEGFDAMVHLAGENIAAGRWNAERKARIRDSRVQGTHELCKALERLERPPRVFASASAVGYYGSRGDELLTEASSTGTGFLAEICRDWERATAPAAERGIRVVRMRIGVILSPRGGALQRMLLPFKLGGGGIIGNGKQYWSWITLDDVVGAIDHVLKTEALRGPVNFVAPNPVTNYQFTKTLGRVLNRPTFLPMPAFAARLALGEMADELLLSSARVEPARLKETEYKFIHPTLEEGLRHLLQK
jgi:uncharacterized protein (TIGR01777 family)